MAASTRPPADRPIVWVNCAVSLDGRLAFARGARARLSGPEDLDRVHRMRAESDAILIGVGTVAADDPSLRVDWARAGRPPGRAPLRVVLDARGRLPPGARILDRSAPTLVATSASGRDRLPPGVETVVAGEESIDLDRLLAALRERGVERLMVEGGARVLASVLRSRRFDRLTVYYAPVVIGGSLAPPMVAGRDTAGPEELTALKLEGVARLGAGFVATFVP